MKNFRQEIAEGKRFLVFDIEEYHDVLNGDLDFSDLGLLPFRLNLQGERRKIVYSLSHRIGLLDFLESGIQEEDLLKNLLKLSQLFIYARDKRLPFKNFYLDVHAIFFNVMTRRLEILYVPIKNYFKSFDIVTLFLDIIYRSNFRSKDLDKVILLIKFLKMSRYIELDEIQTFLINLIRDDGLPSDSSEEETELEEELAETELIEKNRYYLSMVDSSVEIPLSEGNHILGRSEKDSDIWIPSSNRVSRVHLRLKVVEDSLSISDLNSKNGTYVNNRKLKGDEEVVISIGDQISIGDLDYTLETYDDSRSV